MSYQVLCSFDLKDASRQDYVNAYSDLRQIGFATSVQGATGSVTLPTTTVIGTFNSASAEVARDDLRGRIVQAFMARGFRYEVFLAVGGEDHTWGYNRT